MKNMTRALRLLGYSMAPVVLLWASIEVPWHPIWKAALGISAVAAFVYAYFLQWGYMLLVEDYVKLRKERNA